MSDTDNTKTDAPVTEIEAPSLPVTIHAQYIKDLSFENPNAPQVFRRGQKSPQLEMSINLDARPIEDQEVKNLQEVSIKINVTAKNEDQTAFIVEIVYAALLSVGNDVPAERLRPLLFIDIPQVIFPFARQIVANLTGNAGFPPLLLNPVDFRQLYIAHYAETKH